MKKLKKIYTIFCLIMWSFATFAADVPPHRIAAANSCNHSREAACALAQSIPLRTAEINVLCDTSNDITVTMQEEQVETITEGLLNALSQPHPNLSLDNAKRMMRLKRMIWGAKETFLLLF